MIDQHYVPAYGMFILLMLIARWLRARSHEKCRLRYGSWNPTKEQVQFVHRCEAQGKDWRVEQARQVTEITAWVKEQKEARRRRA